jgi:hypothetical protein
MALGWLAARIFKGYLKGKAKVKSALDPQSHALLQKALRSDIPDAEEFG